MKDVTVFGYNIIHVTVDDCTKMVYVNLLFNLSSVWNIDFSVNMFVSWFVDTLPPPVSVIGVAVGVVIAFLFVMAIIMGVIIVTCLVRRGKAKKRDVESTQQNTPSGPVYEDISPRREDIELETNQAYGEVRR